MIYLALPAPPPHSSHCYTDCLCLTVGLLQGESKKHNCPLSLETIGPVSMSDYCMVMAIGYTEKHNGASSFVITFNLSHNVRSYVIM